MDVRTTVWGDKRSMDCLGLVAFTGNLSAPIVPPLFPRCIISGVIGERFRVRIASDSRWDVPASGRMKGKPGREERAELGPQLVRPAESP